MQSKSTKVLDNTERLLRRTIRSMDNEMLSTIASKYEIDIPMEMDFYEATQFLFDELSDEEKNEIVGNYGDAGKPVSHFFVCDSSIPDLVTLRNASRAIFYPQEEERAGLEHFPYFGNVVFHEGTNTLRIRFDYIKGVYSFFDEETNSIRELRRTFSGVMVFRPNSSLLEVRAKHASMARKVVVRTARMNLQPSFALSLKEEVYINRFLDWIYSLNNARIDLPRSDSRSSITIIARHGRDLRKINEFQGDLKRGILRGGHVTIERQKGIFVKFNIFFKPCHLYFTSFSTNEDIEFVASAMEKIVEGYRFARPEKLLDFLK
jgi:hypothetical protein